MAAEAAAAASSAVAAAAEAAALAAAGFVASKPPNAIALANGARLPAVPAAVRRARSKQGDSAMAPHTPDSMTAGALLLPADVSACKAANQLPTKQEDQESDAQTSGAIFEAPSPISQAVTTLCWANKSANAMGSGTVPCAESAVYPVQLLGSVLSPHFPL